MKIIRFSTLTPAATLDFHPDSALLLPGRPMFYPDFQAPWGACPMLAIRINRLGKCVDTRFASRYYDAWSPAIMIRPMDADGLDEGMLSGMDCSITHGAWLSPTALPTAGMLTFNGDSLSIPCSTADIDSALSAASRHTTVKMGDILLLPLGADLLPIQPRSRFIVTTSDGAEIMNLKIV